MAHLVSTMVQERFTRSGATEAGPSLARTLSLEVRQYEHLLVPDALGYNMYEFHSFSFVAKRDNLRQDKRALGRAAWNHQENLNTLVECRSISILPVAAR